MARSVFDVIWKVDGVQHRYTFMSEHEALRFIKELENKGYEPIIIEWDPS